VWDVRYVMDVLDLHWLKTSINHNVAMDDVRAVRHGRVVICNTDAVWRMRGKLVQKLQLPCEVKCAPGVQDGCWKRILWQRRKRCRCSWFILHAIGDIEAVINLEASGGHWGWGCSGGVSTYFYSLSCGIKPGRCSVFPYL